MPLVEEERKGASFPLPLPSSSSSSSSSSLPSTSSAGSAPSSSNSWHSLLQKVSGNRVAHQDSTLLVLGTVCSNKQLRTAAVASHTRPSSMHPILTPLAGDKNNGKSTLLSRFFDCNTSPGAVEFVLDFAYINVKNRHNADEVWICRKRGRDASFAVCSWRSRSFAASVAVFSSLCECNRIVRHVVPPGHAARQTSRRRRSRTCTRGRSTAWSTWRWRPSSRRQQRAASSTRSP